MPINHGVDISSPAVRDERYEGEYEGLLVGVLLVFDLWCLDPMLNDPSHKAGSSKPIKGKVRVGFTEASVMGAGWLAGWVDRGISPLFPVRRPSSLGTSSHTKRTNTDDWKLTYINL